MCVLLGSWYGTGVSPCARQLPVDSISAIAFLETLPLVSPSVTMALVSIHHSFRIRWVSISSLAACTEISNDDSVGVRLSGVRIASKTAFASTTASIGILQMPVSFSLRRSCAAVVGPARISSQAICKSLPVSSASLSPRISAAKVERQTRF